MLGAGAPSRPPRRAAAAPCCCPASGRRGHNSTPEPGPPRPSARLKFDYVRLDAGWKSVARAQLRTPQALTCIPPPAQPASAGLMAMAECSMVNVKQQQITTAAWLSQARALPDAGAAAPPSTLAGLACCAQPPHQPCLRRSRLPQHQMEALLRAPPPAAAPTAKGGGGGAAAFGGARMRAIACGGIRGAFIGRACWVSPGRPRATTAAQTAGERWAGE